MVSGSYMRKTLILFIVGLILLIYWIVRHNRPGESERKENALDI